MFSVLSKTLIPNVVSRFGSKNSSCQIPIIVKALLLLTTYVAPIPKSKRAPRVRESASISSESPAIVRPRSP